MTAKIKCYIGAGVLAIIVGLCCVLSCMYNKLQDMREELGSAKGTLSICEEQVKNTSTQLERFNKSNVEANKLIYDLRKEVNNAYEEKNKDFNCYNSPIPSELLDMLHNIDNEGRTNK